MDRREDAERFIVDVRGDDPELASELRIEERELEAGGPNSAREDGVMVKRLTPWHPREGLSRGEALRYWTERHARLLVDVPGLRGYVQNVCTVGPDGTEPPYAGLGEAWFDSVQAAEDAARSAEWDAVIEDARMFMDFSRLVVAWAEEVRVLPEE